MRADGTACLTLGFRHEYQLDPVYGVCWTKNVAAVTPLMQPVANIKVTQTALVSLNHRIYLIGGYEKSVGPVAKIWYVDIDATGKMGPWKRAANDYAQNANNVKGIGITNHQAVAVGNRIYVAGGSLSIETAPGVFTVQKTVTEVYSTLVDPITGNLSPWVKEPSLIKAASYFGMVYASGALYAIGGRYCADSACTTMYPHQWVQKSEIRPDGRLSEWEAVTQAPQGNPPPNKGCECTDIPLCPPPPTDCCKYLDIGCCYSKNLNMGWMNLGVFSLGRTIGFMGGMFNHGVDAICFPFGDVYYAYLDDCNGIAAWMGRKTDTRKGRSNTSPQAYNGTFLSAGGNNGTSVPDVVHNPTGGDPGIKRDSSFGHDSTELRPNYEGLDVDATTGFQLPATSVDPAPAVMDRNRIYIMGIAEAGAESSNVYRSTLATTTCHVDSGIYLSKPFDLGGSVQLSNVTWSLSKYGSGTQDNPDDWAMVRYRLASEGGEWSCWTPRIPEAGNMPLAPGSYTYANHDAAGNPVPRSSPYWMPLNTSSFRYIQFEVSLYKDLNTYNVPNVFNFTIEYGPAPKDNPLTKCIEVYPVPATDSINLRFSVVPEGAEVKVRIFNVAGEPVASENWVVPAGGVIEKTVSTKGFANGAYIILMEGRGIHAGSGLMCGEEKSGKARAKFVIRRKK